MSDIPSGPSQAGQLSSEAYLSKQGDQIKKSGMDKVDPGFSQKNSYSSSNDEMSDVLSGKDQVSKHRMDAPKEGSESPTEVVFKEVKNILKSQPGTDGVSDKKLMSMLDSIGLSAEEFAKNPLSKMMGAMETNRGKLLAQGFSKKTVDDMLRLADPETSSKDSGLSKMHSFSARLNGVLSGDASLTKVHGLFADVLNKTAHITSIPEDLQKTLQTKLQAFNKQFLGGAKSTLDIDEATVKLMEIQMKLQDNRIRFDQEGIKSSQVTKDQKSEKRMAKIQESIAKSKEAKKSGFIAKVFGGLAVAVMCVVAAVMVVSAVFTGGATAIIAASLMVAAAALVATMMVSAETGGWMMKIFGDSKDAQIGAMVFWSAVIIALSVGSAGVGAAGGAAGAGASTAANTSTAAATVTASASSAGSTAASTAASVAKGVSMFARVAQIVGGAMQVASGAASAASTTFTYDAAMLNVEAKKLNASILRIQQMIEDNLESIQKAINELQHGYEAFSGILKDNSDTKSALLRNMRA